MKHLWSITLEQPGPGFKHTYTIAGMQKPDWNKLAAQALKVAIKDEGSWHWRDEKTPPKLMIIGIEYGGTIDG